ncbi:MAG: PadR family transcriptional regulator [Frankiaceae bacterium]|nr:PadR family transcriptional regulator [Frankiaceae bacterium]
MGGSKGMTELRRGVLGPCVLALLEDRPRFGLELVRDLSEEGSLLTSDGTVYPLLNRLRDSGLVISEWRDEAGQRPRRYYAITPAGRRVLAEFRSDWIEFAASIARVIRPASRAPGADQP